MVVINVKESIEESHTGERFHEGLDGLLQARLADQRDVVGIQSGDRSSHGTHGDSGTAEIVLERRLTRLRA